MGCSWAAKGVLILPVGICQSMILPLSPALARSLPSGLIATVLISSDCLKVWIILPVSIFQSLTVLSQLLLANILPFGLNATDFTSSKCPDKVRINFPVCKSQSLIL